MRFSSFASAGFVGLAAALDLDLGLGLDGGKSPSPNSACNFDMGKSWDNEPLFSGIVAAETETDAAVSLDLTLKEAQVEGLVNLKALESFLDKPDLRLDLAGVKAYVELDLSASAAVFQTVELIASPALSVDAGLLELELGAAFALDLIVGVDAAVDLTAGFYISFMEGDYIDLSIITKEVIGSKLDGIQTKILPVGVGAEVDLSADINLTLGLRLRSHVVISAEVGLLGLDILEAGTEVAIWADLALYTIALIETDVCVVAVNADFALRLGVAVDVSVEILDILDITIAPTVDVTLATFVAAEICMPGRGDFAPPAPTTMPSITGTVTSSSTSVASSDVTSSDVTSTTSTPVSVPSPSANATLTTPITRTTPGLITSTVTTTKEYTITSCLASVPNCPASSTQKVITSTIMSSVTVCPATLTSATPTPTSTKKPVRTLTETLTTVVPCKPTTNTFTPPPGPTKTPVPTVTISDSVTVCPSTESVGETPKPTGPASTPASVSSTVMVTPPVSPTMPSFKPTTPAVPSWTGPGSNATWTSVPQVPGTTYVPSPVPTPVQPAPPVGAAGSVKVGFALALPALVALVL